MNLSTIEGWETPHKTTDDNTFYSDDEPRRNYFLPSCPSPPTPHQKLKKMSLGISFPKRRRVSQHVYEACGQFLTEPNDIPGSSPKNWNSRLKTSLKNIVHYFSSIVYKWYVVVKYESGANICISYERYVAVTYRSKINTSCKSMYPIRVIPVKWSRWGRRDPEQPNIRLLSLLFIYINIRCCCYN